VALQGMGTTCTALVLRGDEAFSGHVGDSRLYLVRDEHIERLSDDHSLVNEMVKQGLITEEQARTHEDRNVITRALGLHEVVEVATWEAPLPVRPHDRFLLCSDGLYDLVSDEEMKDLVVSETPYDAGERLVALAKERGGHDNITVAVLWLKPLDPTTPTPERDTREVEIAP
jgi:protein phosphatase